KRLAPSHFAERGLLQSKSAHLFRSGGQWTTGAHRSWATESERRGRLIAELYYADQFHLGGYGCLFAQRQNSTGCDRAVQRHRPFGTRRRDFQDGRRLATVGRRL